MVNHVGQGQVLDLVVEFAARAGAVLVAPGCPAMVTGPGQETDLPGELTHDVRLVRSGADFSAIVTGS